MGEPYRFSGTCLFSALSADMTGTATLVAVLGSSVRTILHYVPNLNFHTIINKINPNEIKN